MKTAVILVCVVVGLLAGCGQSHGAPDPAAEAARIAEEAIQSAKAIEASDPASNPASGARDGSAAASDGSAAGANPADGRSDNEDLVKVMINANGHLCADIISVRPLNSGSHAEVICKEHVDSAERATYEIDLFSESVTRK